MQKENLDRNDSKCVGANTGKRQKRKKSFFQVELPEKIICEHDKNWMCEAFYNVFDNAVKYSQKQQHDQYHNETDRNVYKIQVRDYGIGIRDGEENKTFSKNFIVVSRQEGRKDAELVYIFPERLFYYKKG